MFIYTWSPTQILPVSYLLSVFNVEVATMENMVKLHDLW